MLAGIASPICLLDQCAAEGHVHVALSHLILESSRYREFYRCMSQRGDWVCVDNGMVEEGQALPLAKVLEAANAVDAKEVILPDVLNDRPSTLNATMEALEYLVAHGCINDFRWMAVPHGNTSQEWMKAYQTLLECSEVGTIGISMFDYELFPEGRPGLLSFLEDYGMIDSSKEYHMLGCWKDLREAWALATYPKRTAYHNAVVRTWVRSMDTGMPVRLGIANYCHPRLYVPEQPIEFVHRKEDFHAPHTMNDAIKHNVDLYKAWCEGYETPEEYRRS